MNQTIKALMVPISEYATVNKDATLFEAVLALEKAQEKYDQTKFQHRAVLVLDKNNKVVGKLSQLNVLRALELESKKIDKIEEISQFCFGAKYIANQLEQSRVKGTSLKEICSKPSKIKVEKFMKQPEEYQYIEEETSLEVAIYQLLTGPYLSLLVVRKGEVVGVLRLTDVFLTVVQAMKENESTNKEKKG
ncbi:MAG: CBS domain-containing protein [Deltaproteobacteria bacterium]|jgi:CBS domain-containing protein|nr:CBS domain-containing protein [Deltaproteobacteria bacterium]